MARKHDCEGMICGHIHVAADRMINGIHYLNSGDWVESNTAIVENDKGEIQIQSYDVFERNLNLLRDSTNSGTQSYSNRQSSGHYSSAGSIN